MEDRVIRPDSSKLVEKTRGHDGDTPRPRSSHPSLIALYTQFHSMDMFSFKLHPKVRAVTHHTLMASPALALGLTALSLLLLVLVLLSVPGPIKGLYWFAVPAETSGMGRFTAGVLGWCETETSNCTYAPLSENPYLTTLIDTGMALTVRIMLPLACYWSIVTLVCWVLLAILSPMGYKIKDLDSISRHLRFAIIEACVLCITLFGNVLCWLAFGLGRSAYTTVKSGGGKPTSGRAMETTAVAALMSLFALGLAIWGLHLRVRNAQSGWKEEAVMVRRRSMAMIAARNSTMAQSDKGNAASGQWSEVPEYNSSNGTIHNGGYRGSMVKDPVYEEEEECLDREIQLAKRNSRDQEMMVRRASMLSPQDTPYAAAQHAHHGQRA